MLLPSGLRSMRTSPDHELRLRRRLLSSDQTFSDSLPSADGRREIERPTLRSADPAPIPHPVLTRGAAWEQGRFPLPDFEGVEPCQPRRRNHRCQAVTPPPDTLDRLYEERAAGRLRPRSVQTYRWLRNEMLACAAAATGRRVVILDLFATPELLGRMLVSERLANGRACSTSTIAHRRTAIRSVASLVRPELHAALRRDPHAVIREALRSVAERRGGGYRIPGGTPRTRGGPTPTRDEVQAILAAMGRTAGWAGLRDRAFATLLGSTAARVTALRTLDAADCHVLPDDRVRVLLHQKNGRARHEVELDRGSRQALRGTCSGSTRRCGPRDASIASPSGTRDRSGERRAARRWRTRRCGRRSGARAASRGHPATRRTPSVGRGRQRRPRRCPAGRPRSVAAGGGPSGSTPPT